MSENIFPQAQVLDKKSRAKALGQIPFVLWFTGLSGAGKSTLARLIDLELSRQNKHLYLLDGDNIRQGLCKDLGFSNEARTENIRRVAEVAKLMLDAGLITLTALISPFRQERQMARSLFLEHEFIEIFVDVPLEVAELRDPKGLYKKARRGEIKAFTGIDSAYEAPQNPEIYLNTADMTTKTCVEIILNYLTTKQLI